MRYLLAILMVACAVDDVDYLHASIDDCPSQRRRDKLIRRRPIGRGRYAAPNPSSDTEYSFDFTAGSLPSNTSVVTSGDTVYRMTSASTLATITPGSGVGIFEDRGRGTRLLVAPSWSNVIVAEYSAAFPFQLNSYNHSGSGNITRTANQGDGPATAGTGDNRADLLEAFNAGVQSYITLDSPTILPSGDSFTTLWVKDGSPAPSSVGELQGSAGGDKEYYADIGGSSWRQLRAQGANGAFMRLFVAGLYGVVGETGNLLVWGCHMGAGRYQLPLVSGATTATASAADLQITTPGAFVRNGALYARGTFQQITDMPQSLARDQSVGWHYAFSMETPGGLCALRAKYGSNANSVVDWDLVINGSSFLLATYTSGVTTPGVGGAYLDQVEWQVGYDASISAAFMRIGFNGGFYMRRTTSGVTSTIQAPTSFYLNSNVTAETLPALVGSATAPGRNFRKPRFLVLGDSLNDITGAAGSENRDHYQNVRPINYILTNAEAVTGTNDIETLAIHGHKFSDQQTALAAYPSAWLSDLDAIIIDMGWNDFADSGVTNATIRTRCQALIDAAKAAAPWARIHLYSPTPGKAGVGASTYARWQDFVTDVGAGYYSNVNVFSTSMSTSATFNDGADNLAAAVRASDLLHLGFAGKQAKGAAMRTIWVADNLL